MDSFKRLLEEDADDEFAIPEQKLRDIERRVHNSTQPIRFAVNTVDLFVPKAVNAMMAMFGVNDKRRKMPNQTLPPNHSSDPANA
jgi:hypothetical protein